MSQFLNLPQDDDEEEKGTGKCVFCGKSVSPNTSSCSTCPNKEQIKMESVKIREEWSEEEKIKRAVLTESHTEYFPKICSCTLSGKKSLSSRLADSRDS